MHNQTKTKPTEPVGGGGWEWSSRAAAVLDIKGGEEVFLNVWAHLGTLFI